MPPLPDGYGRNVAAAGPWLAKGDLEAPGRVRLFCFPHAGSGAAAYYRWKRPMAEMGVAVCPVLLPGREGRAAEPPMRRVRQVMDEAAPAMLPHLRRPYAVFGHSMGALLAFEFARAVRRLGAAGPELLVVSGRSAPGAVTAAAPLHELPDAELLAGLRERFGDSAALRLLDDPELRALYLPTLRADLELVATHQVEPDLALDVPMLVLGGLNDPSLADPSLDDPSLAGRSLATSGPSGSSQDGAGLAAWSGFSRGRCTVERLPGGHFDHLGAAQELLLQRLAAALQG